VSSNSNRSTDGDSLASSSDDDDDDDDAYGRRVYSKYRKYLNPDDNKVSVVSPSQQELQLKQENESGVKKVALRGRHDDHTHGTVVAATATTTTTDNVVAALTRGTAQKAWRAHSPSARKLGAPPNLEFSYRYSDPTAATTTTTTVSSIMTNEDSPTHRGGESHDQGTDGKKKKKPASPKLTSAMLSPEDLSLIGGMLFGDDYGDGDDNTEDGNTSLVDEETTSVQSQNLRYNVGVTGDGTTSPEVLEVVKGDPSATLHQFVDATSTDEEDDDFYCGDSGDIVARRGGKYDHGKVIVHREDTEEENGNDSTELTPIAPVGTAMVASLESTSTMTTSSHRLTQSTKVSVNNNNNNDSYKISDQQSNISSMSFGDDEFKEEGAQEVIETVQITVQRQHIIITRYDGEDLQYRGNATPMEDDNESHDNQSMGDGNSQSSHSTSLGADDISKSTDAEIVDEFGVDNDDDEYQHNQPIQPEAMLLTAGILAAEGVAEGSDDEIEYGEEDFTEVSEDYTYEAPEPPASYLVEESSSLASKPIHDVQNGDGNQVDEMVPGNHARAFSNDQQGQMSTEELTETDGDDSIALWEKSVNEEYDSSLGNSKSKSARGMESTQTFSSEQSSAGNGSQPGEDSLSTLGKDQANSSRAPLASSNPGQKVTADEMEASINVNEVDPRDAPIETSLAGENSLEDEEFSLGELITGLQTKRFEDDLEESDEFSLKASQEFITLSSTTDRPEYDHRASRRQPSLDEEFEKSMNQGLSELDTSFSMNDDVESAIPSQEHTKRKESKGKSAMKITPNKSNPESDVSSTAGVWHHIVRGSIVLLLLAAIGVPLYFLVWYDSDNSEDSVGPILPPSDTKSPSALESMSPSPVFASPTVTPTKMPSLDAPVLASTKRPTSAPVTSTPTLSSPVTTPSLAPSSSPLPGTSSPAGGPSADELRGVLISAWPSLEDDLANSSTPQFLAFDWLLNNTDLEEYTDDRILQRFALATFYYSTDGNNWIQNDRWLSDEHECLWYTSSTTLPCDNSLQYTSLDLERNDFSGTIPSELALLSNSLFHVALSSNGDLSLTGSIPSELGLLTLLETINLSDNQLTDSLPTEIGNWRKVRIVDFRGNQFRGSVPATIGNWTKLTLLNLENNKLDGSLPTTIESWSSLLGLYLANNTFTGAVPVEIGNLDLIQNLELQRNRFTSMPSEVGKLLLLRDLSAGQNEFAGPLFTEIGNLLNLLSLDLAINSFTGSLPSSLGNLVVIRDHLDLSQNSFSGTLPSQLGKLLFLRNLLLQSNDLSGPVPATFANLDSLNSLRLEGNRLTGTVPAAVCTGFEETLPIFVTDCGSPDGIVCGCCMFCCDDGASCECQFSNTEFDFLCKEFTELPALEERLIDTL
jgi:Leucine-rich repeat (LRR) protein